MKYVPILLSEIELEYVRSRGPGGQNVNKTNSAALLRWNVPQSQMFTVEDRQIIALKLADILTSDGDLIIRSDEFRDQNMNRKRCLEKLEALLEKVFFKPKVRRKTKPTYGSKVRRHTEKKRRGEIKSGRGKVKNHDWD